MKKIKFFMYLTLPMTIMVLVGCTRTYDNGYTQEISVMDAVFDIFSGKPTLKPMEELKPIEETGDPVIDAQIKEKNEAIDEQNKAIRKHNEAAKNSEENPDSGLLGIIGVITTAAGYGAWKMLLSKKNLEAARNLLNDEHTVLKSRYQAVKEEFRENGPMLAKIKKAGQIGAEIAAEQKEVLGKHSGTIETFKKLYSSLHKAKTS